MTYLELCKRLRQEVNAAGTGPSTVLSQTGESRRFVDWIATADEDIQRLHNAWLFMVGSFTINTVASDGSYSASDCVVPITDLREWKRNTFKIYSSASGVGTERKLDFIEYQDWYDIYNTGTQTSGQPTLFTIGNDLSIKISPKPDGVYVLSGEYQKSVTTMDADADTPNYPSEFHMAAVYRAMMKYGRYAGAQEVYQYGENEYKKIIKEMRRSQLPIVLPAGPLA